jgi:hypothetical protein
LSVILNECQNSYYLTFTSNLSWYIIPTTFNPQFNLNLKTFRHPKGWFLLPNLTTHLTLPTPDNH